MSEIGSIQESSGFVVPLRKTQTGFQTVWGDFEAELPTLPESTTITRITSEVSVQQGSMGKGYVKVDNVENSGSGKSQYLWVTIKRFDREKQNSGTHEDKKKPTYKSHVDQSHRDTATPRANQYDSDLY